MSADLLCYSLSAGRNTAVLPFCLPIGSCGAALCHWLARVFVRLRQLDKAFTFEFTRLVSLLKPVPRFFINVVTLHVALGSLYGYQIYQRILILQYFIGQL